jgi:hypothetical protein
MFIGHFAIAYIFIVLFPMQPPLIPLIGVSFPDLLWPFFILAGIEKVKINPKTALQRGIVFERYPYFHSLLIGTLISFVPGIVLGIFITPLAGLIFTIASASHWILDSIVHLPDLPILGFGKDKKVGLALWNRGKIAFFTELIFYILITLFAIIAINPGAVVPLLILGFVFHLLNANSFFGFSKKIPSIRLVNML